MTFDGMTGRIKVRTEIHKKREPQAALITEALNEAVGLLENQKWHYPSEGDVPENDEIVLVIPKETVRGERRCFLAVRFWYEGSDDEIMRYGYVWEAYPSTSDIIKLSDDDIHAWRYLPELQEAA